MAPFLSLFALLAFALATSVLASPHIPRHVHNIAHRAPVAPIDVPRRALNKRCVPRPSNSTSAYPTSTAPNNVAPSPSVHPTSAPAPSSSSSALPTTSYAPQTPSQEPSPSTSAPATTSTPPPQPTTTSTPPPQPTTTSTPPPEPTTSSTPTSSPPPAQTSSSSSNTGEPSYMIGTQTGDGTFYEVGLGACGITNVDSDLIVAVSQDLFDSYPGATANPNQNPVCNKHIQASYQGKYVTVKVVDRCTGCSLTSLDFSPSAFSQLADQSIGRISISWVWID